MASNIKNRRTGKEVIGDAHAQHRLNMAAKWEAVKQIEQAQEAERSYEKDQFMTAALAELIKIK